MDTIFDILNQAMREAISPGTAAVAIAVIGLNIHFGFTGLLNIGQAGFMVLGAYGFAIATIDGVPLPIAVLCGFGAALVFALVLGLPTLKLRGDYLAIVTISAAEILRFVGRLSALEDFTGGALGLRGGLYQGPFLDLSFLSDTRFTLLPFNYTEIGGGSQAARIVGLLVAIGAIAGAVVLLRRGSADVDDSDASSKGDASAVLVTVFTGLLGLLLVVLGLVAVDFGGGAIVVLVIGIAALVSFGYLVRQLRRTEVARSTVVRMLQVSALVVVTFFALFFVFPVNYANNFANGWWMRLVAWSMVLLSLVVVALLVRSPWGRLLRGVREDQEAMRSLGKNVFAIKMQALIIGGLFGALGGMLYVLPTTVQPDSLGRQLTFFAYTALLLGGAATVFGPVLGTVLFYAGRIMIREIADAYVPNSLMSGTQTDQFSFVVVGVALMLLVIFRPQGITGDKRELRINV